MKRNAMLAVDMGASNGRVVWGQWHESGLECREINRFDTVPIQRNGPMLRDMQRLMAALARGISQGVCRNDGRCSVHGFLVHCRCCGGREQDENDF